MKKRIAILVRKIRFGGMERVAAQLSELLAECGYKVYIFCFSEDPELDYKHAGDVILLNRTILRGNKDSSRALWEAMSDSLEVKENKKKYNIDVTISFAPEMNLLNIFSDIGDKKIVTFHSCQSLRNDFKGVAHDKTFMMLSNNADKVVTVSKWCSRDLNQNFGIKKSKIQVIYNPIENSENKIKEKKENIIAIVGGLREVKRQWHAIRAFSNVVKNVPDAQLLIAGEGKDEEYLKTLTKDLGLEANVSFLGFVKDIQKVYEKAKLIVFCSASEALPCSILEALSYGVPVVAADCPGGIREIFKVKHKSRIQKKIFVKGGILVPSVSGKKYGAKIPLNYAERMLAEGIEIVLKDSFLRKRMIRDCLKTSKLFYKDRIKKQWMRLIEDML